MPSKEAVVQGEGDPEAVAHCDRVARAELLGVSSEDMVVLVSGLAEGVHKEEGEKERAGEAEVLLDRVAVTHALEQALALACTEGDSVEVGVARPRLREAGLEAVGEGVALLQGSWVAEGQVLGETVGDTVGVGMAGEAVGKSVPPAEAVGTTALCVAATRETVAQALALPPALLLLAVTEGVALAPVAVALGRDVVQEETLAVALAPPGREAVGDRVKSTVPVGVPVAHRVGVGVSSAEAVPDPVTVTEAVVSSVPVLHAVAEPLAVAAHQEEGVGEGVTRAVGEAEVELLPQSVALPVTVAHTLLLLVDVGHMEAVLETVREPTEDKEAVGLTVALAAAVSERLPLEDTEGEVLAEALRCWLREIEGVTLVELESAALREVEGDWETVRVSTGLREVEGV